MFAVARHVLRRDASCLPRALHGALLRHDDAEKGKEVTVRPPVTLGERVASAKRTAQHAYGVGKKSALLIACAYVCYSMLYRAGVMLAFLRAMQVIEIPK